MKKLFLFVILSNTLFSQTKQAATTELKKPKLVVGVVVDQMRQDYITVTGINLGTVDLKK